MAEPKYNPKVSDRANELIKQGYNPQKAAEKAFSEFGIRPDSNEAYLYVIDAVDPKKAPFLKEWQFGGSNNNVSEEERKWHATITGSTSSKEQTDRAISRTNQSNNEYNKSLSEESSTQSQSVAQAKQELFNSSSNAAAIAASAEAQSRNINQYSASRTVEVESVKGGGTITTRIVNTEELSRYRDEERKIAAEVRAANKEARNEILREQGIDPATASPAQIRDANAAALEQGRGLTLSVEVERRLGKRPDPQYETTTTPPENSTTTTVTTAGNVTTEKRDSAQQSVENSGQATTETTTRTIDSQVEERKLRVGNKTETGVSTQPVYSPDHPMADGDGYVWPTRANSADQKYSMTYAPDHPYADADGFVTVSRPLAPGENAGGVDASLRGSFESAESARPSQEDSGQSQTSNEEKAKTVVKQSDPKKTGKLLSDQNPLFELTDYTYSFVLAALTPDVFNKVMTEPGYKYVKNNVIIAGGSRSSENLNRNSNFLYDFYIQDLKFDTIIGLNSRTKGSNVLGVSFRITEPLGASFFERLYVMANELGIRNYLEVPYMLIIEFRGNDTNGNPVLLTEHTKYIPIKILGAKMKITGAGSEYTMEATPFNQVAYQATEHGSTPVNVQIKSSTVGEFFANNNNIDELAKEIVKDQRELARDIERRRAVVNNFGLEAVDPEDVKKGINRRIEESRKKFYNAASYTQALNAFQLRLKELEKVSQIDTYSFVVDPEIAKSMIVQQNLTPSNRSSFPATSNGGNSSSPTELSAQKVFPVNAGTSILDVINTVMKNSDYIRNQITEKSNKIKPGSSPEDIANAEGKSLQWYKILPVVTIKDFDFKRNTYARSIEYHIVPYIVHNTKSPLAPKSLPKKWIQEYKYIFTGDNQSIIDLDITFEVMFYSLATANREQWNSMNSAAAAPNDDDLNTGHNRSNSFQPNKIIYSSMSMSDQIGSYDTDTAKGIAVSELYNSLYSSQRGDMINVRLKIIGDPRYIKQDELFFNPANTPKLSENLLSKNNSIIFDYEERYINLLFFTPIDYDSETGLLSKDSKFLTSKFSGIYRILRVENTFQRGKFEQTLDLVRLFDQPTDVAKTNQDSTNGNRTTSPGTITSKVADKRKEDNTSNQENESAAETARLQRQIPGSQLALTAANSSSPVVSLTEIRRPSQEDFAG